MNDHDLSDLGELEREVLRIVWRLGSASADAVRAEVAKPLKESTVRTVLRRLEGKGHLTHTVSGRTFIYRAAEVRGRAAARAVKRIADWFCEGSVAEVVAGLVDARLLDQKELADLTQKIAKAKGGIRK
ncbi:MAG TPA: BlaI/MecI/CopY family transcriptional regulator [Steroidobacteraceae bacterium]|jgi:predicted transcriptional regulator